MKIRSNQTKPDQIRYGRQASSCSGSVSDLSSFAHLALGGAPRGFLVPRLRTAPTGTNTRVRLAPRPRHHNLHRVHLNHGRRLAPARIRRRRWRRSLGSGRWSSTPRFGIRASPLARSWGSGRRRRLAAAPNIAFFLRTRRLNTHARPWSSPPLSRRC